MELEQPLHALFDIRLYYYIFKMLISIGNHAMVSTIWD